MTLENKKPLYQMEDKVKEYLLLESVFDHELCSRSLISLCWPYSDIFDFGPNYIPISLMDHCGPPIFPFGPSLPPFGPKICHNVPLQASIGPSICTPLAQIYFKGPNWSQHLLWSPNDPYGFKHSIWPPWAPNWPPSIPFRPQMVTILEQILILSCWNYIWKT